MAKTLNCLSNGTATVAASATRWYPFGTSMAFPDTPETSCKVKVSLAGVVSKLTFYVSSNATTGSSTVRTRKNTANGNQSVSVGAGATGRFQDLSNTDTIAAGDLFNYQITAAAGGAIAIKHMSTVFDPTNTAIALSTLVNIDSGGFGNSNASSTTYPALSGDNSYGTTEPLAQYEARIAGTLKNLSVYVSSNARTTTTTFRSRKNTANGAMSVAYGSGATGLVEDLSNTDTIVVNDKINTSMTTGTGTGAIIFKTLKTNFEVSGNDGLMLCQHNSGINKSSVSTIYLPPAGSLAALSTTEADTKMTVCEAFTFSNLGLNVTANARTATTTFRSRKNEADGNQVVSVASSTTGWLEDTTNTDVCAAGTDYINYSCTITTGTGTITFRSMTMVSTLSSLRNLEKTLSESVTLADTYARLQLNIRPILDTLTLTDSNVRLRYRPKTISDSLTLADTYARVRGRWRILSDSVALTAPLAKLTTRLRTLSQPLALVDTHAKLEGILRLLSHPLTLSDSNTRARGKSKATTDSLTLSDSLAKLTTRLRPLGHSLAPAGATVALRNKLRLLAHPLTLSDTHAKLTTRLRPLSDSLVLAHATDRLRFRPKTLSDSMALTDSLVRLRLRLRTLAGSVTLTDSATRLRFRPKTLSDSMSISSTLSQLRNRVRQATGSLALAGSPPTKLTTRLRTLGHTIIVADQLTKGGQKVTSLFHSLTTTDSMSRLATRLKTLSDSITLSDSSARLRGKLKTLSSDSLALASTAARLASRQRVLADSMSLSGAIQQLKGGAGRFLSDSLALADSIAKQTTRIRVLGEGLGLSHASTRLAGIMRVISAQNLTISDIAQIAKVKSRLLLETGPAFSSSMDRMTARVRAITQNLQVLSVPARITSRIRSLSHSRAFTDTATAIKGGVGAAVLPTAAFVKHLTNKLIFKK